MAKTAMKPEQAKVIRDGLLDVAQELFEVGGVETMSFRAIAKRYGCSSMKAYSYFESKADIIDALRIRAYDWLAHELNAAMQDALDPRDALKRITLAYLSSAIERPRMYELLFTHLGQKEENHPDLINAKVRALGVCQDAIVRMADESDLQLKFEPEKAAHLFWVAAHGVVSLHAGGFFVLSYGADEILPTLFDTTMSGIFERRNS